MVQYNLLLDYNPDVQYLLNVFILFNDFEYNQEKMTMLRGSDLFDILEKGLNSSEIKYIVKKLTQENNIL